MPPGRYRRYAPYRRVFVPPAFVPGGFLIFAIFFIITGSIITATTNQKFASLFKASFFKERKEDPIKIAGPILLGVGLILLFVVIILCIFGACVFMKQKNWQKRQGQTGQPLTTRVRCQLLPASAYPHQPAPQNYPATPRHSAQPVGQFPPGNSYPQQPQSHYPSKPPNYYPPISSCLPPSGSPPPGYSQNNPESTIWKSTSGL